MIDPLAMPIFKPLWEAFPYLPGCFASWRGMSLGEISASAYATADGERLPSGAIVGCMAKHAARSLGNDVGDAVKRYFSRNNAVLSANLHGIEGNVWHFFLAYVLANHENAFSTSCEIRGHVEGSINDIALQDFRIFRKLFAYVPAMPRLVHVAGDLRFIRWIPDDKTKSMTILRHPLAFRRIVKAV